MKRIDMTREFRNALHMYTLKAIRVRGARHSLDLEFRYPNIRRPEMTARLLRQYTAQHRQLKVLEKELKEALVA